MKNIIKTILIILLLLPNFASAQFTKVQGGTGITTAASGTLLMSTDNTLRYTAISTTTLYNMLNITGGTGGVGTTTINGVSASSFTFATSTSGNVTLTIATSTGTLTFTPGVTSGYVIPLTASTTQWAAAFASTTALTPTYIRSLFSNTATGLTYTAATGVTSLTAGFVIPTTASTSEWFNDAWRTSGTNVRLSTTSNNVGIGTTTPGAKVDIYGVSGNNMPFRVSSSTNVSLFEIEPNGNVGIGVSTPFGKLSVVSADAGAFSTAAWDNKYSVFGPNAGSATGAGLGIGYSATVGSSILSLSPAIAWLPITIGASTFSVMSGTTLGLHQNNLGNVGVGTTSPITPLHVIGDITAGFGASTTRIVGIGTDGSFSSGKTGIFRFSDQFNQMEITFGGTMKGISYHGWQFYNFAGEVARFGINSGSLDSYFTGKLGVGMTPASQLSVNDIGGNLLQLSYDTVGTADFLFKRSLSTGALQIYGTQTSFNNIQLTAPNTTGGVGIGANPTTFADGAHTPRLIVANPSDSNEWLFMGFNETGNYGYIGAVAHQVAWAPLVLSLDGGAASNVGIGTSTPRGKLHVINPTSGGVGTGFTVTNAGNEQSVIETLSTTTYATLVFSQAGTSKALFGVNGSAALAPGAASGDFIIRNNSVASAIRFSSNAGTSATFTMLNNQSTGVGTSTPRSRLDVYGTTATSTLYVDNPNGFIMKDATGNTCTRVTSQTGVLTAAVTTCP